MTIWLDMDGVLADFDRGAIERLGTTITRYEAANGPHSAWPKLKPTGPFYASLLPMLGAQALWFAAHSYSKPVGVLTALPSSDPEDVDDAKRKWITRLFGPGHKVVTCQARDKPLYCEKGDIIIDDRPKRIADGWRAKGGVLITYYSAEDAIQKLAWWMGKTGVNYG